jgi:hypothetical protein
LTGRSFGDNGGYTISAETVRAIEEKRENVLAAAEVNYCCKKLISPPWPNWKANTLLRIRYSGSGCT